MRAEIDENYHITAHEIPGMESLELRDDSFEQLPGFPKAYPANPNFKNLRNVALYDLDGDGVDDILWATNDKIFVYTYNGLLWERALTAVAIYPPSVGDIDGDGLVEVVLATGGVQVQPKLYAFEQDGSDVAGWPVSLNDNWVLSAPALSDMDGDSALEIIVSERDFPIGYVHILKGDGTPFSANWPVALDGTPAVTPSIGDVDGDGKKDIVIHSVNSRYIFGLDGQPKPGFPITTGPAQKYSYQSPVLPRFSQANQLEVVGASHGDAPEYYVFGPDGNSRPGWPIPTPGNGPTYSTPTVVEIDGEPWIFMGRTLGAEAGDMLFAWDADGNIRDGFPINKMGGCEGIISVADIDDDGQFEILFGSTLFVGSGPGFLHAYELDGTPVDGFPLQPRGLTYLNGAALSDVNGDSLMDLVALTYTLNFGAAPDTVFLNAYNLNVPYSPERVLWSTYKGNNTRDGLLAEPLPTGTVAPGQADIGLHIYPNPAAQQIWLFFSLPETMAVTASITDAAGKTTTLLPEQRLPAGARQVRIPLNNLPGGLYWICLNSGQKRLGVKPVFLQP